MEKLHSDLIPYSVDQMVHHPLVIGLAHDASYMNQRYRQKKGLLAKAEADGDWGQYIFLHERPYRIGALEYAAENGLSRKSFRALGVGGRSLAGFRKHPPESPSVEENLAEPNRRSAGVHVA